MGIFSIWILFDIQVPKMLSMEDPSVSRTPTRPSTNDNNVLLKAWEGNGDSRRSSCHVQELFHENAQVVILFRFFILQSLSITYIRFNSLCFLLFGWPFGLVISSCVCRFLRTIHSHGGKLSYLSGSLCSLVLGMGYSPPAWSTSLVLFSSLEQDGLWWVCTCACKMAIVHKAGLFR